MITHIIGIIGPDGQRARFQKEYTQAEYESLLAALPIHYLPKGFISWHPREDDPPDYAQAIHRLPIIMEPGQGAQAGPDGSQPFDPVEFISAYLSNRHYRMSSVERWIEDGRAYNDIFLSLCPDHIFTACQPEPAEPKPRPKRKYTRRAALVAKQESLL